MAGIFIHTDPVHEPENAGVSSTLGSSVKSAHRAPNVNRNRARVFGQDLSTTGGHNPSVRSIPGKRMEHIGQMVPRTSGPKSQLKGLKMKPEDPAVLAFEEIGVIPSFSPAEELGCDMFADASMDIPVTTMTRKPKMRFGSKSGSTSSRKSKPLEQKMKVKSKLENGNENENETSIGWPSCIPDSIEVESIDLNEFEVPELKL